MAKQTTPGVRSTLDPRAIEAIGRCLDSGPIGDSITTTADLETHDPRFVGRISDQIRRILDERLYQALGWRALQNPMAASQFVIEATGKSAFAALLLSTSGRGYIREAAVHRIKSIPGPFSLALLANRLNDWVPNVRRAAEARLNDVSPTLDRSVVAGCIEYLWRFDEFGRASSTGRDIVATLVGDAATTACLRETLLQSSDDRTVRLAQLLMRSPVLDDLLVQLAMRHKHPRVRAIASKVALESVFAWRARTLQKRSLNVQIDRLTLARALLNDRSADVQYNALQYLSQNLHDVAELEGILKRYLLHPRRRLSEAAQWRLGKRGVDWLDWLRQESGERPLDVTLARLFSRVGTQSDGERLWQSAQRASGSDRLTFLFSAARLKQEDAINETRQLALQDSSPARSRAAVAALLEAGELIAFEELMGAASNALLFARRGLLAQVRRHSVVNQLMMFCRLEANGCSPDSHEFTRLSRRLNRGKFDPTAVELDELRRLSAGCPRVAGWMRRLQLA